ncbi:MAG: LysR family transcriptional regulator [Planctomycetota bacterium]|nr:LysR family transcriptional regulator [Planctomycetota bacterium]
MELRQLESFRAVLREGSFTAAAKKLHMTQPAVSLHIKALEEELGARLLDRDGRGVRLTPSGSALLEAADAALASLQEGARRIREIQAPERGSVVLACGDTVALHLLPPVLTRFGKLHPQADVVVHNHGSKTILEMLLNREADVGIVTRPPFVDPALWTRTLLDDALVLALPPKHPLLAKKRLSLRSLHGEAAVLLAKGAETRSLIDRGLRAEGVELQTVMESGNLEVVKAYVAGGLGLSIIPEMALTAADRRRMVIRPLPGRFPARRIAVARRKDRTPGILTTSLLKLMAEHFRAEA